MPPDAIELKERSSTFRVEFIANAFAIKIDPLVRILFQYSSKVSNLSVRYISLATWQAPESVILFLDALSSLRHGARPEVTD